MQLSTNVKDGSHTITDTVPIGTYNVKVTVRLDKDRKVIEAEAQSRVRPDRPTPQPDSPPVSDCAHRGEHPVEAVECKTCKGRAAVKVYACDVLIKCTIGKRVDGIAGLCTAACTHYERKE